MEEENHEEDEDYVPPTLLPKRYLMIGLLFLFIFEDLISRDVLRLTAELLMEQNAKTNGTVENPNCPHLKAPAAAAKYRDHRGANYGWDAEFPLAVSRYFTVGYALGLPIFGYIVDRFVCAKLLGAIFLVTVTVLCLLMPLILRTTNGNEILLLIIIFCKGFMTGISPTAFASMVAHWMPARIRAFAASFAFFGIFVGTMLRNFFAKEIARNRHNYDVLYYMVGGIGIVNCLLWFTLASSSPDDCLTISTEEKMYLEAEFGDTVDHRKKRVPLKNMLFSSRVHFVNFVTMGHMFAYYFALGITPVYYTVALKLDPRTVTIWATVPTLLLGVTACAGGAFSDWALHKGHVTLTVLRKVCTNIGIVGAAIYFMVGSMAACEPDLVILLFVIGTALQGFNFAGIRIVIYDITPNYAGTVMGICTSLGILTTIFIPYMLKSLAPHKTIKEYRNAFWVTLVVSFITNVVFVVFGRIGIVKWNTPPIETKKKKNQRTVS